jgi:hypothetical protein
VAAPRTTEVVDPRVVVGPAKARALLDAVWITIRRWLRSSPACTTPARDPPKYEPSAWTTCSFRRRGGVSFSSWEVTRPLVPLGPTTSLQVKTAG